MSANLTWLLFLVFVQYATASPEILYKNRMRAEEYDYIVVGSGSAGAVVASRLSEDLDTSVLLLEAGGLPTGLTEIPLLGIYLLGGELDWAYLSEPQEEACLGLKNQQAYLARGKVLGGSSSINSMIFVRGNSKDFDEWERKGATGWGWDNVLYYFNKLEDMKDPELAKKDYHGTGGPLSVTFSDYESELQGALLSAGKEMGYETVDANSGSPTGFSKVQGSVRDGRRCSTEKAYLRPAAGRENLDILYNAHATKILFTDHNRANAVRFEQNNASHVVRARKEIILSAGAFGTPQLLMLSGIGPKEHLEELGIPVIADLPVGQNLQDHIQTGTESYALNSSVGLLHSRILLNPDTHGQFVDGKGPLAIPLGVEVMANINSKYQDPSENWPDIVIFFLSFRLPPPGDEGKVAFNFGSEGVTINLNVCRPKSRGFVKLRTTDPYDHPIIDPRYLTHEYDVKIMLEAMKFSEKLMEQSSFAKYGPERAPAVVEGCQHLDLKSDEYKVCAARRITINGYHHCCTAKMGDPKDPTTVVDSELRVKGVYGLRVADASVMPDVTSGNTNAPSIMIGEKAADLIRGRYWDPVKKQIVIKK